MLVNAISAFLFDPALPAVGAGEEVQWKELDVYQVLRWALLWEAVFQTSHWLINQSPPAGSSARLLNLGCSYVTAFLNAGQCTVLGVYNFLRLWAAPASARYVIARSVSAHSGDDGFGAGSEGLRTSSYVFLGWLACDVVHVLLNFGPKKLGGWDTVVHHAIFASLVSACIGYGVCPFAASWLYIGELSSLPLNVRFFLINTGRGATGAMKATNGLFALTFFLTRVALYWCGLADFLLHGPRQLAAHATPPSLVWGITFLLVVGAALNLFWVTQIVQIAVGKPQPRKDKDKDKDKAETAPAAAAAAEAGAEAGAEAATVTATATVTAIATATVTPTKQKLGKPPPKPAAASSIHNRSSAEASEDEHKHKHKHRKKMKIKKGEVSALVELPKERVGEAAELAAAAFLHSPGYCYIFEGFAEEERRAALTWLFEKNFAIRRGSGVARCAFATEMGAAAGILEADMVCFFMLQTPSSGNIGALTMLRHGILDAVPRFGLRPFFRLLEVKGYHERLERAFVADQRKQQEAFLKSLGNTELPGFFDDEHWCSVERMVVHPDWQGRGVGSQCLGA